ncbi:ABC transporter ATP-binding protein [Methylotetracoccus oryzae]|uniref:ABC transporter ATP-binding protein n=1 Tax=Methylotetracoccus oryzae TaxID=1919059 RepID=UPI001119B3DD|nr:ABC transporter ATP-binding protein [Methylotetracoccus oryzae]
MVAITVHRLTKRFGTATVLADINLRIEPGELFFLLGPSGCGKTTLLRHLAGFYTPDAGTIRFDDEDVTHLPAHQRGTGMMFQSYALWPHLSVAENVAFGLEERRCPKAEIATRVAEALAAVKLDGLGERRIQQLSGGQQQRVALARALVIRPKCLFLDEPLSNLDAKLRLDMRAEIRRICKEYGLTGIYVTHDQEEALSMADRLAVMEAGRLVQVGAPLEVYRNPANRMVAEFIGETNILSGTVQGAGGGMGCFEVDTAAGRLTARCHLAAWQPAPGDRVQVSIRPEALTLSDEPPALPNRFKGIVENVIYLGATAQYELRVSGSAGLKVTQMNPAALLQPSGAAVTASVGVDDVVLLPG